MKKKHIVIVGSVFVILAGAAVFYFLFAGGSGATALASVNGEKITVAGFLQEVEKIQEPTRGMVKENPAEFLDMLIMKTLLVQEMKKQGIQPGNDVKGQEKAIQEFLQNKFSSAPAVSKEELVAFYETHKGQMEGKSLEEVTPIIEQFMQQQKQEEEYMRYLQEIRERAAVEIDKVRLQALAVKPPDAVTNTAEDLTKALQSGRPVLVDFGSNSCIPCRQLRPILQEIKKEQAGKLEVLVIDVNKIQNLAVQYQIQVIPTLVFFDSKGKEMFRHQGFKPKTALMEELKKIGVG
ncbi:MAG: hypothetical protein C4576_20095 [Desulfobacteraceae bacterium]|nr:MAG: hypothetical protein C4576_20095 [Desulfobacteraceae bacterium]